jgi:hypothetical protein
VAAQYRCQNARRRAEVLEHRAADGNFLNGIDYVEVGQDRASLSVSFLREIEGHLLSHDNFVVEGGARQKPVKVVNATPHPAIKNVLTVTLAEPGDSSAYTLRLCKSAIRPEAPAGFDPVLSSVEFVFSVEQNNSLACPPESLPSCATYPPIENNYLAKDYESFRRVMLDRMSLLMPGWTERHPADPAVALIELLAYVGDRLSYYQDAVATEAYLGTARRRTSVRRHARLLDYAMHEGCNARAWVCFEVESGWDQELPPHTILLTRGSNPACVVKQAVLDTALAESPLVFETCQAGTLRAAHNRISFYTWSDTRCCLPAGSTRATLRYELIAPLQLSAGDVLVFEEIRSATSGDKGEGDPSHRHAVQLTRVQMVDSDNNLLQDPLTGTYLAEIEWDTRDALPFDLCLSLDLEDQDGQTIIPEVAVARGNVVLSDHGQTIEHQALVPSQITQRYYPQLPLGPLTWELPFEVDSAHSLLDADPHLAQSSITLELDGETWEPVPDLLNCNGQSRKFCVEVESDGTPYLRFGDGTYGMQPTEGQFSATFRVGNGRAGNIGAEAIGRVVTDATGIRRVWNPLPAVGGTDPEPLEDVRRFAPIAFRTQERAVTPDDYARIAERHSKVQKAAAVIRWSGSWYTVWITIDRKGGKPLADDPAFERELLAHMNRYRLAGYDVELCDPHLAFLDLQLAVTIKPGYIQSDVRSVLEQVLSDRDLPCGQRGFFHPDNFTFGQTIYLSQIYQVVMDIAGVESVQATTFGRRDANDGSLENGYFKPKPMEVIQFDPDPDWLKMEGGL